MRARYFVALACALSTAGVVSCSDDNESQDTEGLNPQGGSSGSANGMAGNAGSANGGSSNGGSANGGTGGGSQQPAQGGSANTGSGGSSNGGSAGSGMGGTMAQGGSAGESGAGGGEGEPDAGPIDPPDDTVSFAADLHTQIFVARCAGCHGTEWGSPNLATAYAAAVANADEIAGRVDGSGGDIMPRFCGAGPGQGTCLSVAEVELIQQWVDDDTPE